MTAPEQSQTPRPQRCAPGGQDLPEEDAQDADPHEPCQQAPLKSEAHSSAQVQAPQHPEADPGAELVWKIWGKRV